jgi:hypothetical protein
MGLKAIKSVPKNERREVLSIDLSIFTGQEGDKIQFREPCAADLFPDSSELKKLRIRFAEFPEAMLYQVMLMGRCYVPDPSDAQVDESPMEAIGSLARANRSVYFHIAGEFIEAFPNDDIAARVSEAKNVCAE